MVTAFFNILNTDNYKKMNKPNNKNIIDSMIENVNNRFYYDYVYGSIKQVLDTPNRFLYRTFNKILYLTMPLAIVSYGIDNDVFVSVGITEEIYQYYSKVKNIYFYNKKMLAIFTLNNEQKVNNHEYYFEIILNHNYIDELSNYYSKITAIIVYSISASLNNNGQLTLWDFNKIVCMLKLLK